MIPETNNLSLLNYKFKMARTPETEYRVQSVYLPGLNLGSAERPSPFVRIPYPGNLSYDDLNITFQVGEKMKDYLEIFDWMVSLGYPDEMNQYPKGNEYSDCNVVILNSSMRPEINVRFTSVYPISISPITFDSTLPEVQYATASVSFRFTRFYYEPF